MKDLIANLRNALTHLINIINIGFVQEWLISMAVIHPKTEEDHKISDMVFSLFR